MTNRAPLNDLRILVTRTPEQAQDFSGALIDLGAKVIEIPLIAISPPDSWEPLDRAATNLAHYDWIVFASTNAVDSFISRIKNSDPNLSSLAKIKIAAIGPKTAERISQYGLTVSFNPSRFIQENLVEEFPGYPKVMGLKLLWPRTNVGRTYFIDKLAEKGAHVETVLCYKTGLPGEAATKAIAQLVGAKEIDVIALMSSQTARNLAEILVQEGSNPQTALAAIALACIGPETASEVRALFGKAEIVANEFSQDGLIEAMTDYFGAIKH